MSLNDRGHPQARHRVDQAENQEPNAIPYLCSQNIVIVVVGAINTDSAVWALGV